MSLSFLTPSRTVLMISDDALFVYAISAKGVRLVDTVPWSAEDFERNVANTIAKDCGGKPVVIVNDMVEQHYRKEKVPRVSVLDKQNVVKRKLKVAFPNYPVRAALPLKEKVAKTKNSLGGSVYIFAALPVTDAFTKTMGAAAQSMAPIVGFGLLPVEASDMIKKLADKTVPRRENKAKWTVFMGQHHSGALRQIVIKDGELALTRMTPIVETDDDPVLWANEVHQELQATMSYLSRFGFDSSEGLNVILLAEPSTGDIVSELIETECHFHSMTTQEAADALGLPLGVQDNDYYADPMHAAWVGKKSRLILPMKARQIDNVSKPRQAAVIGSIILFLGAGFQAYTLLDYTQSTSEQASEIEAAEQRKAQLDLQYEKEVKKKNDLGFDIQLIQSSLAVQEELEKQEIEPLSLFYNIGLALGRDMRIDEISIARPANNPFVVGSFTGKGTPLYIGTMQMTFPSSTNAEKGNREVQALRSRIQSMMPDHVVKVTKLLEDYEYSEEIVVETGNAAKKSSIQDYVAEITIEGPAYE